MKILIGLDESAHSARALEFVTRMRWPAGSRVIVLSALPVAAGALGAEVPAWGADEAQRRTVEALVERAETTLREAGFPTEQRVLPGDPREVVVRVAEEERADLIVVGSHGHTGIARLVLGSVSSHVVAHAPCSVLVVKKCDGPAQKRPR